MILILEEHYLVEQFLQNIYMAYGPEVIAYTLVKKFTKLLFYFRQKMNIHIQRPVISTVQSIGITSL